MKSSTKWITASVLALVALAAGGRVALRAQDKPKQDKPAASKEEAQKKQADRIAAFKKAFPAAKTSLAAALATGEKEGKGRAHSVEYTLTKDGKLTIEVGLLVNDKLAELFVDPESGKAGPVKMIEGENGKHEEGEEEEEDE